MRHLGYLITLSLFFFANASHGNEAGDTQKSTPTGETANDGSTSVPPVEGELRDYSNNDFKADLVLVRAGAHDESGTNEYYFVPTLYGVLNTAEERIKEFSEQQKIVREFEPTKPITIKSLDYWRAKPKDGQVVNVEITGDTIRELIAESMNRFSVQESEVAVRMDIEMWEVGKKFVFFGEDTKIASVHFFPVPQTKFDTPARTNLNLEMRDDKGTLVRFAITYDNPVHSAKK